MAAVSGESVPPSASASAAPSPHPAPVPRLPDAPERTTDGYFRFTGGGIELLVDASTARVARLSLDGQNILLQADGDPGNFTVDIEGSTLVFKLSQRSIRFRLDTARRMVEVTRTDTYDSSALRGLADIARVPSGTGLSFFPAAKVAQGSTLKLNLWQHVAWFAHEQAREPKTLEAWVESTEGWIATASNGLILIKVCDGAVPSVRLTSEYDPDTKQRAWVELEQRSAMLSPGGGTLAARLFLRKLPPNLVVKPGNQELVGFVRGVIQ